MWVGCHGDHEAGGPAWSHAGDRPITYCCLPHLHLHRCPAGSYIYCMFSSFSSSLHLFIVCTVEPPNKGHIGIVCLLSLIGRLSLSRRSIYTKKNQLIHSPFVQRLSLSQRVEVLLYHILHLFVITSFHLFIFITLFVIFLLHGFYVYSETCL